MLAAVAHNTAVGQATEGDCAGMAEGKGGEADGGLSVDATVRQVVAI